MGGRRFGHDKSWHQRGSGKPSVDSEGGEAELWFVYSHTGVLQTSTGGTMLVEPQNQEEKCRFHPCHGKLGQLFTLTKLLESSWEFAPLIHVFCELGKGIRSCPGGCPVSEY